MSAVIVVTGVVVPVLLSGDRFQCFMCCMVVSTGVVVPVLLSVVGI